MDRSPLARIAKAVGLAGTPPSLSVASLVLANLLPLVGVVGFGWDAFAICLLYWAENVVIGAYSVLRIVLVRMDRPVEHLAKIIAVPFFAINFGGFCAVHGFFLLALFAPQGQADHLLREGSWWGPLVFVQLLGLVIAQAWRSMPAGMGWPVAGLALSHGISFVRYYLVRGECERADVRGQMGRPYTRIVVLHVAIVAGGFLVKAIGSPVALLFVLVAMKTGLDVHLHLRSHRSRAPDPSRDALEER